MNQKLLHILRHSLGLTKDNKEFRNHFVTGPGSKDYESCEELVNMGYMIRNEGNELTGGDYCYIVTKLGKVAAKSQKKLMESSESIIIAKIAYVEQILPVEHFLELWDRDSVPTQKDYDQWLKDDMLASLGANCFDADDIRLIEDN